ncbi:hypothetical protein RSAG8_11915, partial [Rhizoctonia solani AG-8 WAC10335]
MAREGVGRRNCRQIVFPDDGQAEANANNITTCYNRSGTLLYFPPSEFTPCTPPHATAKHPLRCIRSSIGPAYKNHTKRGFVPQVLLLQPSSSPAFSRQLNMAGGPVAAGGGVGGSGAPKNKIAGILMTTFAAFGGILFGYDTGVISGVKEMTNWLQTFGHQGSNGQWEISTRNESLIVSILSAGTFFGALLAAPMGDMLGRKWGLIAACLVFSVGVALQTGATGVPVFVVGRVFAGLGVGMVSCLVPMYQSECSPKWIRGAVVSCYQWAITIGLLLAAIVNNATKDRQNYTSWRIPIAIQFVWAAILAGGMFLLPESPRYLIKRGRDQAAQQALARLLSLHPEDPEVETELNDIRANLRAEEELGSGSYADCFKQGPNKILTRVMTGIFLQAWQQLTGI